ncbi:MAG TPA: neutral zinc metallopeptidase, partial [Isosphaeraceae bacterium]|nr:neutral zinc metallopeptidase [Isosphaeraceae bacterium]
MSEALFSNSQSFWSEQISQLGGRYRPSKLSFFTTSLSGHCKVQAAVTGPFYCPVEETVYLDQSFLQLLDQRSRGHSELTLGYLIAHEVAHHIQNVIGTTALVEQARSRS